MKDVALYLVFLVLAVLALYMVDTQIVNQSVDSQVAEAIAEYAEAGLPLLPVEVLTDLPQEECGVYAATYTYNEGVVRICTPDPSKQLILHELGHAWDDQNMTDELRSNYAARFGEGDGWFDMGEAHHNRHAERFANTVTAVVKGMLTLEDLNDLIGNN